MPSWRATPRSLARIRAESPLKLPGISKISVQTGTSHGGVVLPDGSIKDINVDFDTLAELSAAARSKYGLGGAVQHGASTLPVDAFGKFAAADAVEVHLATAFQNAIFDAPSFPAPLLEAIYAYLDAHHADERKDGQTDAQFYYNARKRALGPFKRELWQLEDEAREPILADLRSQFELIMRELRVAGLRRIVNRYVARVDMPVERDPGMESLTSVDLGDEGE